MQPAAARLSTVDRPELARRSSFSRIEPMEDR
jgi:hypothetical protein